MIETLFWGFIFIVSIAVFAIVGVLSIYFLITKQKKGKTGKNYKVEDLKEIK